jgi:hypothetical protein
LISNETESPIWLISCFLPAKDRECIDIRVEVKPGSGHFTSAAYEKHAKLYLTNGGQFILASQELFKYIKIRSAVYWYMKGMALELIFKGILYDSDKKKSAPRYSKKSISMT